MKRTYIFLALVALTGCMQKEQTSAATDGDRIYTVDEFLAQPELRKKFFDLCANDPGHTESSPNCVNVISAERIASAGTTIPRIVH